MLVFLVSLCNCYVVSCVIKYLILFCSLVLDDFVIVNYVYERSWWLFDLECCIRYFVWYRDYFLIFYSGGGLFRVFCEWC